MHQNFFLIRIFYLFIYLFILKILINFIAFLKLSCLQSKKLCFLDYFVFYLGNAVLKRVEKI